MVKIRLTKVGRKGTPAYRICITDAREKRDSMAIEYIGHYSPLSKEIKIDAERAKYWLGTGAQPSPTVARLLVKSNILDKSVLPQPRFKKQPGKKAKARADKKASAAA